MDSVHLEVDNVEDHPLAYMMVPYPKTLDSKEPTVGQFSYYDPRSESCWLVEVQTLKGIMKVGCVMSSPFHIVPERYITCHGKILKILKGPNNIFKWPSER